jgi:hypothetical protein
MHTIFVKKKQTKKPIVILKFSMTFQTKLKYESNWGGTFVMFNS